MLSLKALASRRVPFSAVASPSPPAESASALSSPCSDSDLSVLTGAFASALTVCATNAVANTVNTVIDALIVAFQFQRGAWAADLRDCGSLCQATRFERAIWGTLVTVQRGPRKRTHLMYAALRGDEARVAFLVGCAPRWADAAPLDVADVGTSAADSAAGRTALHYAIVGSPRSVKTLLVEGVVNARAVTNNGRTALEIAIEHGDSRVVEMLLKFGAAADANTPFSAAYVTRMSPSNLAAPPLVAAAAHGALEIVRLLIAHGANLKAVRPADLCNAALATAVEAIKDRDMGRVPISGRALVLHALLDAEEAAATSDNSVNGVDEVRFAGSALPRAICYSTFDSVWGVGGGGGGGGDGGTKTDRVLSGGTTLHELCKLAGFPESLCERISLQSTPRPPATGAAAI